MSTFTPFFMSCIMTAVVSIATSPVVVTMLARGPRITGLFYG